MRKKRKGSGSDGCDEDIQGRIRSTCNHDDLTSYYSLEDYDRINKRCKEDADDCDADASAVNSLKSRLAGVATAPPCGASSTSCSASPARGIKRKIGCIEVTTQTGRKNKIEDDYTFGATLGRGKFGSVSLCRSRASGVEFACKTLKKGEETVHREVEIMQHLSGHPGVVTLHAVYEELEFFHLVMEFCSGGRLIDQMVGEDRCSEQWAANVFKDVLLVIKYCHEMGVVHRDIKPENILLVNSGKIKLADFGLAMRISNGQTLSGLAGSPAYVAPEVLQGNYSEEVDIWSAGVLLHALLTGVLPFQGDSLESVFEAIKSVKLDFQTGMWVSVSKPARDLLSRMLARDVSARITADEALRHPWVLFYTDRVLRSFPFKSKLRSTATQEAIAAPESCRSHDIGVSSRTEVSWRKHHPILDSLNCWSEQEGEECDFVDALAVAISQVKISEPKRSRLCSPATPIEQQCSANITVNSTLCKAF
ncbi:Serine/threonine-protein kinase PEPKR2 [Linum perenne]